MQTNRKKVEKREKEGIIKLGAIWDFIDAISKNEARSMHRKINYISRKNAAKTFLL